MAEQFYTILTAVGKAKIANAAVLGKKIELTELALGDGGGSYYNPTEDQTELRNEVWRGAIGTVDVDGENPNWIIIQTVVPSQHGGFMIREAGVFDDEGDLIAVGKYPETYKPVAADGSIKDLIVRMILEVSNTASVVLKVDPTVILATQQQVYAAEARAKAYTDQEVGEVAQELAAHKTENASEHGDLTTLKTSQKSSLVEAINELFTSVSDGKNLIATAITDMGQSASGSDTFAELANSIRAIKTGDYSVGDILEPSKYLIAPEIWQFTGHTGTVYAVAVDNNGNIYSGSNDRTVRKISSDGEQIWQFTGHTHWVRAVAVDNNGNIYSGSFDNTVRKISPDGEEIWQFTGHTDWVYDVAVDNNGNVYSGSTDKTVRKISPDGEQIWQFTGHTQTVYAVAVDNNGNVYSGSADNTVRKISPDGEQIWQFTEYTDSVEAVTVDNIGNIYSGSDDRTVRKINPDGEEIWQFTGHTGTVYTVAVDNNGNVYSGSEDRTLRKISPDGEQIWKFTEHTGVVFAVAVDNIGNVYSGSFDRTVRKIIDGIKIIA